MRTWDLPNGIWNLRLSQRLKKLVRAPRVHAVPPQTRAYSTSSILIGGLVRKYAMARDHVLLDEQMDRLATSKQYQRPIVSSC